MKLTMKLIINEQSGLFWNSQWGWGSYLGCEWFDLDYKGNLPIDGKWIII